MRYWSLPDQRGQRKIEIGTSTRPNQRVVVRQAFPTYLITAWRQVLVLVLAAVVGLQGGPLASLVSNMAPAPCVCEQQDYCPRNPGGGACDHHGHAGSTADDQPHAAAAGATGADASPTTGPQLLLRSCDTGGPDGLTATASKWLVARSGSDLRPPCTGLPLGEVCRGLTSQREGDDIADPPWPRPA